MDKTVLHNVSFEKTLPVNVQYSSMYKMKHNAGCPRLLEV
jgi:hypothetical protein